MSPEPEVTKARHQETQQGPENCRNELAYCTRIGKSRMVRAIKRSHRTAPFQELFYHGAVRRYAIPQYGRDPIDGGSLAGWPSHELQRRRAMYGPTLSIRQNCWTAHAGRSDSRAKTVRSPHKSFKTHRASVVACESKVACNFAQDNPAGFKSCFETARCNISKIAAKSILIQ